MNIYSIILFLKKILIVQSLINWSLIFNGFDYLTLFIYVNSIYSIKYVQASGHGPS